MFCFTKQIKVLLVGELATSTRLLRVIPHYFSYKIVEIFRLQRELTGKTLNPQNTPKRRNTHTQWRSGRLITSLDRDKTLRGRTGLIEPRGGGYSLTVLHECVSRRPLYPPLEAPAALRENRQTRNYNL